MMPRTFVATVVAAAATTALAGSASAAPPLRVSHLTAPTAITGTAGHARALVHLTTQSRSRVIVRLINSRGVVVNTVKSAPNHARGRVWLAVDATTLRGFQLPAGRYTLQGYAVVGKRRSNVLRRAITIRYTPARGTIEALTVPAWPSTIAGVAAAPGGQIVTAVAPDSATAQAGLQVGDVVRTVNGRSVDTPGAWLRERRALGAHGNVTLGVDRAGQRRQITLAPSPDWAPAPNWPTIIPTPAPTPTVALAAVEERLEAGDRAGAEARLAQIPVAQRRTAPAWLATGLVRMAQSDPLGAQAAFNYAIAADPAMSTARFQRGVALIARGRIDLAAQGLRGASNADPADAVAPTFRAFALLRADRYAEAYAAGQLAIAIDSRYAEGHIATGIAHIALKRKAAGVAEIRKGLVLMDDPARRQQMIDRYLVPATR